MSVMGEIAAALEQSWHRNHEALTRLEQAGPALAVAAAALHEAAELTGMVSDGTEDESINGAVAQFTQGELAVRHMLSLLDEAKDHALAADQMIEQFKQVLGIGRR